MAIIKDYNINFNKNIIMECIDEISNNRIYDKKEYFNSIVYERLELCNDIYAREFENKIDNIVADSIYSDDIKTISRTMIKLSRLANSLCSTEITLYNVLSRS